MRISVHSSRDFELFSHLHYGAVYKINSDQPCDGAKMRYIFIEGVSWVLKKTYGLLIVDTNINILNSHNHILSEIMIMFAFNLDVQEQLKYFMKRNKDLMF